MTGYALVRAAHSDWRWLVLATLILVLVRRGPWTAFDERVSKAFVAAVDIQVALGLVLYFAFSPFFTAAHSAFRAAMHDPITRFFSVEHETAMLIAFTIAHVGRVRIRRAEPERKRRIALITALLFLGLGHSLAVAESGPAAVARRDFAALLR